MSVDADVLALVERAVTRGSAASLSAWVNEALRQKLDHDARLHALSAALREFEAQYGRLTDDEIAAAGREAKRRAVVVRGTRAGERRRRDGR